MHTVSSATRERYSVLLLGSRFVSAMDHSHQLKRAKARPRCGAPRPVQIGRERVNMRRRMISVVILGRRGDSAGHFHPAPQANAAVPLS